MSLLDFFGFRGKAPASPAPVVVTDSRPIAAVPAPLAPQEILNDAGLQSLAAGLGTDRDKMTGTSYVMQAPMSRTDAEAMYQASPLARRVIEVVPEDMVRTWRRVSFDDPAKDNLLAVEREETRLNVAARFQEAQTWARLYGGAVILINNGDADLSKPIEVDRMKKGGIKSLVVFDRWRISGVGMLTTDLDSPNFGMYEHYILGSMPGMVSVGGLRVHWSRLLRFDGVRLPYFMLSANGFWHESELASLKEKIKHADVASAGIATMIFEANVDVLKVPNLGTMLATDKGVAQVTKRFLNAAMIKSFNRMFLIDDKETYEKKSNNFANLDGILDRFHTLVSAVSGIPVTRLFGEAPGGLNASGDNDVLAYYDSVKNAQKKNFDPLLQRFDPLLARSALGSMPDDWSSKWLPLWEMSEADRATMEKTRADRDSIYLDRGVIPPQVVAMDLKENGIYLNLTDEHVEEIEEQAELDAEFAEKQREALAAGAVKPDPAQKGPPGSTNEPEIDENKKAEQ